ncbi:MAG: arginine deiminase, partial [Nocardioidaceae bacterium]|nr:arginine deiminase [Nocardioidaceae bacterium]
LEVPEARSVLTESVLGDRRLGDTLRASVAGYLEDQDPRRLADVLMAGLAHEEMKPSPGGLVYKMMDPHDFVIDPLPNLLFTRDSSVWIGDQAAVTSLAMPARGRETTLTGAIYRFHPRFTGTELLYEPALEHVEGGDVLLLAPGVLAIGVGERTTPAGAESLARSAFADGLAHTVLAVPIQQQRASMHLDTVCTMVDSDAVVMYPAIRDTLRAYPVAPDGNGGLKVSTSRPFLEAAADAMGIEKMRVIDTGLDPVTAEREQWDDGNNTLAIAPRVAVAYERNVETNERLVEAGIDVIAIPGSELGSGRGGPRCMSCPVRRDPLPRPS